MHGYNKTIYNQEWMDFIIIEIYLECSNFTHWWIIRIIDVTNSVAVVWVWCLDNSMQQSLLQGDVHT